MEIKNEKMLGIGLLTVGTIAIIHWKRNYLNEQVSTIEDVKEWTELTPGESIFHRMGPGNENNRKFVSPDGHSEAIFRPNPAGAPPTLVLEPDNLGTYNFFGPRFFFGIAHAIFDVLPYFIFGNTPADMFNSARFRALFS